jgi:acetyl-CoA carboxylase biotin carboxyl carrier protein
VGLTRQELASLLDAFEKYGFAELVVDVDGTRFEVSSGPGRADGAGEAARAPRGAPVHHDVLAPSVGILHLAPGHDEPPFPEIGQPVRADQTVCVLEVADATLPVKAGIDGVVTAVHAEDGTLVEYGDRLLSIEPYTAPGSAAR